MTSPFQTVQVKVYPFAGEIYAPGGVKCKTPQELWDKLMKDANAFAPSKNGPQLGDMAFSPSPRDEAIEQYLREHGRFKLPMKGEREKAPAKVVTLGDF